MNQPPDSKDNGGNGMRKSTRKRNENYAHRKHMSRVVRSTLKPHNQGRRTFNESLAIHDILKYLLQQFDIVLLHWEWLQEPLNYHLRIALYELRRNGRMIN